MQFAKENSLNYLKKYLSSIFLSRYPDSPLARGVGQHLGFSENLMKAECAGSLLLISVAQELS